MMGCSVKRPAKALLILVLATACRASELDCSKSAAALHKDYAGYAARISYVSTGDHAGECKAEVVSPDEKTVFEAYGHKIEVSPVSGQDVNGDEKPDLVLGSIPAEGRCCYVYDVLSLGDPVGLVRELKVSVPLTFGDLLGDGKVEISGRDFAYDGFEGFTHAESPFPLVYFRLKGDVLFPVSSLFWTEYEREIREAKGQLPKGAQDDLTREEGEKKSDNPTEQHDPKADAMRHNKALVMTMVLNYLYAGKGKEAWDLLGDWWPPLDKPRIRQLILQRRMKGLLSEINRSSKPAQ